MSSLTDTRCQQRKIITWKVFGETRYRTRVVAAKTKPLCPLAYRVLTQYTVLVHLIYLLNINCVSGVQVNIKCYFTYGVRGCTCKITSFLDSTQLIYLKTSLALVWSTVIDKIYLLLIFNQEIIWQNNHIYMKFWDTQTLWPLLYPTGKRIF